MRLPLLVACAVVVGALVASATMYAPEDRDAEGIGALSAAEARAAARDAPEATSVRDGLSPPTWEVGDAWRVQFDKGEPVCWLIVVDDAEEYRQGVWCPTDEAPFIAAQIATLQAPWIGAFSRDLEGLGHEDTFRWYDWPLEDGKQWTTSWNGLEVDVTATRDEHGYAIEVVDAGSGDDLFAYDYDPDLEWWSFLSFESGYDFLVHERASGWEGEATYAIAEERYEASRQASILGTPAATFTTTDDDELLALVIDWDGTPVGTFQVRDGSGSTVYDETMTGDAEDVFELMQGEPGVWTIADAVTGLADATIRVMGVSVETLEF